MLIVTVQWMLSDREEGNPMEEMARRIDRSGREGTTGVSQGSLPVHVAMVSMGTHAPALLKIRDAGNATN